MSFEKTLNITKELPPVVISLHFKWILSETEPEAPDGYEREPDMDFDFGQLGKYWAFIET